MGNGYHGLSKHRWNAVIKNCKTTQKTTKGRALFYRAPFGRAANKANGIFWQRSEDVSRNRIIGFEAKARSRLVIFGVSLALLLLLGAILQTSIFGRLTYKGAVPDIMLCIVICLLRKH